MVGAAENRPCRYGRGCTAVAQGKGKSTGPGKYAGESLWGRIKGKIIMLMLIWNNIARQRSRSVLTVIISLINVLVFVMG